MSSLNADEVLEKTMKRGISTEVVATLSNAGVDVKKWLKWFQEGNLCE